MDEVANKLSSRHNVVIMPVASQDVFVPLTLDMFPEIEDSYNYTRYGAGMYICIHMYKRYILTIPILTQSFILCLWMHILLNQDH